MINLLNTSKCTLDACHEMVGYMLNVAQNQGFVEVRYCLADDHQLGEVICTDM
jgi:hypothetical protein